jgi:hydrogenase expression/formation protein HypC
MCVAVPGRVIERQGLRALVEVSGVRRQVSVLALPEVGEGDYVLISLGMALEKITEEESRQLEELWQDVAAAQETQCNKGERE